MDIKTKFNIGDEVWYMMNNKVCSSKINKINYHIYDNNVENIIYSIEDGFNNEWDGNKLYKSKEDLIKSL